MGVLAYFDADGAWQDTHVCDGSIAQHLARYGLAWGRWPERESIAADAPLDAVLDHWQDEIAALGKRFSIAHIDRVTLTPDHADWTTLRSQFITEHTHADAEVRCFLDGTGLFYVRTSDGFIGLFCEAGEWVALPAGIRHFFDAGDAPQFDALRLFSQTSGWVAHPTGTTAPPLPLLDDFVAQMFELTGNVVDDE
ncbi:MAG TPA: hypothetical protein VIP10_02465 [Burkholderiaceae bacterium]